MLAINARISIPLEELEFTYARSGGPGGQNVNKVNSKAILRWSVTTSPSLPEDVRARFLSNYGSRITVEGELVITSQKYRDQRRNYQDALDKLTAMLMAVAEPPTERRATEPSRAVKQRRVEDKRQLSKKKQQRRRFDSED